MTRSVFVGLKVELPHSPERGGQSQQEWPAQKTAGNQTGHSPETDRMESVLQQLGFSRIFRVRVHGLNQSWHSATALGKQRHILLQTEFIPVH